MNIDIIFKIAAIGIVVAVIYRLLVQSGRDEQALLLSLAGVVFVLLILVGQIGDLFTKIRGIFGI